MRRLFPVPTSVLLLACLLAGASVALAGAEVGRGSSGDQQTIPTDASRRFSEESPLSMRGAPGQLLLEGTVTDILGTPMEGVPVKLFGNGRVIHSTLSGADGRYRL
ncbi:MAG: carboxypeptidase-like regulatory domain-containing protein, partial [Gemmatimonadota bacterium]|nr:carboxypeptidase-like regulatory domain-containing protein [Gemmatimonadota bacterium]